MRARTATADDYAQALRFVAELKVLPSEPDPPREWWDRFHGNGLFLEEAGEPIAFGVGYALGEGLAYVLYVAVAPHARKRGVGLALMHAIADKLRADGCTEWSLNVIASNEAALALYRRLGFQRAYSTELLSMPWSAIESLPREDIVVEELRPEGDAEAAREFGLPAGRLATARQMPGRFFRRAPGGVMVFDPTFPGAPLIRARRPAIARAMLEAIREHRKPDIDELRVNVEDNATLAETLRSVGAQVVNSLLHLRGSLPTPSRND